MKYFAALALAVVSLTACGEIDGEWRTFQAPDGSTLYCHGSSMQEELADFEIGEECIQQQPQGVDS